MKKRILSILLCFVMVLGMLPAAAFADSTNELGSEISGNVSIATGAEMTISAQTTITGNVTISGGGTLKRSGENGYIVVTKGATLTLDGVTVDGDGTNSTNQSSNPMIRVENGGKLIIRNNATIKNCYNSSGEGGAISNSGTVTVESGIICNNFANSSGGAICNYGNVTLQNGSITNNKSGSDNGGGVCNKSVSTFTMNGGTISSNTASRGGGVYNNMSGAFTMNRGMITGNSANDGGGVFNEGYFTMSGGTISGNAATTQSGVLGNGGGGGGVYNGSTGTFNMTGGTITGNNVTVANGYKAKVDGNGGGVFNVGTFNVSGTSVISGNVKDGTKGEDGKYTGNTNSNVYVVTVTVGSETLNCPITVESGENLYSGAAIYITGAANQTVVTGTTNTTGFYSDTAGLAFVVDNENNCLKFEERTDEATIGNTEYQTLAEAFAAANNAAGVEGAVTHPAIIVMTGNPATETSASLPAGDKLQDTNGNTYEAKDSSASVTVGTDSSITLTSGKLAIAAAGGVGASVSVKTGNNTTASVTVPAGNTVTVDQTTKTAAVSAGESVTIDDVTYTAKTGGEGRAFSLQTAELNNDGDSATVLGSVTADKTIKVGTTGITITGANSGDATLTKGSSTSTITLGNSGDKFTVGGTEYTAPCANAAYTVTNEGSVILMFTLDNLPADGYGLDSDESVMVGNYIYTAPSGNKGDVKLTTRTDGGGKALNPAVVLQNANGTVEVALTENKDTKTTYTAVSADTTFAMSESDTNTKSIDLLSNGDTSANSKIKVPSGVTVEPKNSNAITSAANNTVIGFNSSLCGVLESGAATTTATMFAVINGETKTFGVSDERNAISYTVNASDKTLTVPDGLTVTDYTNVSSPDSVGPQFTKGTFTFGKTSDGKTTATIPADAAIIGADGVKISGVAKTEGGNDTEVEIGTDGKLTLIEGQGKLVGAVNTETTVKTKFTVSGVENTVAVTVPENVTATIDLDNTPPAVKNLGEGKSVTIGGVTYTAVTDSAFPLNESKLTKTGETAVVPAKTAADVKLGNDTTEPAYTAPVLKVPSGNSGSTTVTKGERSIVVIEEKNDTFTVGGQTYTAEDNNARFAIYKDGTVKSIGNEEVIADGSSTTGSSGKLIENPINSGNDEITVTFDSKNNKDTVTVPGSGSVKVGDTTYTNGSDDAEMVIEVATNINQVISGAVKLDKEAVINVGSKGVAVKNTGDQQINVTADGEVTVPQGGQLDIGGAKITGIKQDVVFEVFDVSENAYAKIKLTEGQAITINEVVYTGGEGGGAITIDPIEKNEVTGIEGIINITVGEDKLTTDFNYGLMRGQSATIGKYVYTAPKSGNVGDVTIKGRGTDKAPAIVMKNVGSTVDVVLSANKDTKTTYTAANANTVFIMSADDTNTKNIELLDNTKFGFEPVPAAQSALKFTDKNSYTVNSVTYQAQTVTDATTGEDANISYTVTYSTKAETADGSEEPKTVDANIISVDNGSKVIATMSAESVVMIASGTVGDNAFTSTVPFTATNSGASIIIDSTDSQKVNSISTNGSNLTPVYDENSGGSADTPDIIGYQVSKNSSSGGSSGGSHKNSNTTTTVPVSGNETSTKVSASVSGNVATVDEIKQTEIEKLGVNGNVTIDLSGMSDSVTGVNLPVATVKNMIDSSAENLEIKLPNADVTIDKTTLSALTEQASSADLRLVVDNDTEARKTLSAAQETSLSKMNQPKLIEAYFISGDKRISDFKGGTVSISIALDDDKPIRVWYLKDNGEYEKVDSTYDKKTATLKLKHFSHYVIEQLDESAGYASCSKDATCPINKFTDAENTAWYHDGVHYCLDNGLMVGTSETSFSPDANITRGQIVTMLWRKDGSPTASGGDFADVASTAYYAQAIAWAASNDIVTGYGDEKFGPDDSITREQLAAILYRYAKYKGMDVSVGEDTNILDFDDAQSISTYAVSAIQWACGAGIMNGTDTFKLSPKATATRAQAASMMQRFLTENK